MLAPMWQAAPFTPISAMESPNLQLAAPRILLYTGRAPQATPRIPRLVRRACAQARVDLCKDNADVDNNANVVHDMKR